MPHDRSMLPVAGHLARQQREAERWSHRYHNAVNWAVRLHAALEGCREALEAAGSSYEPPAGWDLLLTLPEL